jgi:outer membrane immunogenic protein
MVPAPIAVHTWTGCYVGVDAGYMWGTSKQTYGGTRAGVPDAFLPVGFDVTGNYDVNGPMIGGEVGCNYQTANWVFGIEVDGAAVDATGTAFPVSGAIAAGANPLRRFTTTERWLATARGRVGYAYDKWLWYLTGGAAWAGLEVNNDACLVAVNGCRIPDKVNRVGWIVGVGSEYALTTNLSVKLDVLYADFGTFHYNDSPAANGCVQCYSMDVKLTEWIVRGGFKFRFN